MWFDGGRRELEDSSAGITYLDGTRPMKYSRVPPCPHCGLKMAPGITLKRCFDEGRGAPGVDPIEAAPGSPGASPP